MGPFEDSAGDGRVWAGTYDPRQSAVVKEVSGQLVHRMMVGVITPGEEVLRDRDRESFSNVLGKLNDGLSELCHNMRKSVEEFDDVAWPPEMDVPYPPSAQSSNLSNVPSQQREQRRASSARHRSKGSAANESALSGPNVQCTSPTPDSSQPPKQKQHPQNKKAGHAPSKGGNSVIQHDLWVNDRVEALMREVKEAHSKLRTRVHDRAVLDNLGQRLDSLDRRSAVAGLRRDTSVSDPVHAVQSPHSLPTIRESSLPHRPPIPPQQHNIQYNQAQHVQQYFHQYPHRQQPANQPPLYAQHNNFPPNNPYARYPHQYPPQQQPHNQYYSQASSQGSFLPPIAGGGWGGGAGAGGGGGWGGEAAGLAGGGGCGWGDGGGGVMNQKQLQNGNGNDNNALKFRQDFAIADEIFSPRASAGGHGGERSGPRTNQNSGAKRNSAHRPAASRSGAGSRAASHVDSVDSSVNSAAGVRKGRYKPSAQPDAPIGKVPVPPAAQKKQNGRCS